MVDFYTDMKGVATDLIGEFGRIIQLVSRSYSDDGPSPTISEISTNITAIEQNYKQYQVDGANVMAGDKMLVFVSDIDPTTKDRIIDGSQKYSIVNVFPKKPGDVTILHKIQVRV